MRVLGEGNYVRLARRGRWEYAERTNATGVVAVVAVTAADEMVLIEQPRPIVGRRVLDLPAGLAGDLGPRDTTARAARRELEEETGFRARRVERIGDIPSSPGMTNEIVTFFRARGLTRVSAGGGDASERIKVHVVPREDVAAFLARKIARGALVDVKLYAGLYLAGVP